MIKEYKTIEQDVMSAECKGRYVSMVRIYEINNNSPDRSVLSDIRDYIWFNDTSSLEKTIKRGEHDNGGRRKIC